MCEFLVLEKSFRFRFYTNDPNIASSIGYDWTIRYERGRRQPSYRFLLALTLALNVSLEEIFGLTTEDWQNREEYRTIYGIPNPAYKPPKRQRPPERLPERSSGTSEKTVQDAVSLSTTLTRS
jgi:transcriptional regulator with XRE-family HTH domain